MALAKTTRNPSGVRHCNPLYFCVVGCPDFDCVLWHSVVIFLHSNVHSDMEIQKLKEIFFNFNFVYLCLSTLPGRREDIGMNIEALCYAKNAVEEEYTTPENICIIYII